MKNEQREMKNYEWDATGSGPHSSFSISRSSFFILLSSQRTSPIRQKLGK
jgi:hypothetical protein